MLSSFVYKLRGTVIVCHCQSSVLSSVAQTHMIIPFNSLISNQFTVYSMDKYKIYSKMFLIALEPKNNSEKIFTILPQSVFRTNKLISKVSKVKISLQIHHLEILVLSAVVPSPYSCITHTCKPGVIHLFHCPTLPHFTDMDYGPSHSLYCQCFKSWKYCPVA